jgi:hypothetical protein
MACFAFCVALTLVALVLVYRCENCTPQVRLTLLVGYGTLILVFFFGLLVLLEIAAGRIDLAHLLSEAGPDGKTGQASLSRFQLLIFTFVIAFSLFLITVANNKFPPIPTEILTLLGISASTYAVSKGIQASSTSPTGPDGQGGTTDQVTSTTQDPTGKITTRVHSPASGQTTTTVHDPATGQTTTTVHQPTTVTTSTTVNPPPPTPTA